MTLSFKRYTGQNLANGQKFEERRLLVGIQSPLLVFDIETIPDVAGARRLDENLATLSDLDVVQATIRQNNNNEFLPHYLHRIVAISVVFRSAEKLEVLSLGKVQSGEREIIHQFFAAIEKYTPMLISWNGSGFDLPVLHYRALFHKIEAPCYWETGEENRDFRYNNYLSRYHYRHLDLMDILAGYQTRANAPLHGIATLLGLPGKMGMDGSQVWTKFQENKIEEIRDYCETDVLNTYLVFLHFELMRGKINERQFQSECELLKEYLQHNAEKKKHFLEFLQSWCC